MCVRRRPCATLSAGSIECTQIRDIAWMLIERHDLGFLMKRAQSARLGYAKLFLRRHIQARSCPFFFSLSFDFLFVFRADIVALYLRCSMVLWCYDFLLMIFLDNSITICCLFKIVADKVLSMINSFKNIIAITFVHSAVSFSKLDHKKKINRYKK